MSPKECFALVVLLSSGATIVAQPLAYVANSGSNTVSTINVGTAAIGSAVTVPSAPSGIAVTPDGSTLYVASGNAGEVTAISTAAHTVLSTIKVGSTPTQVAINPAGTLAYVVDQGSNQISVINTSSRSVTATIPVGSHPTSVAFSSDGTRAYVANQWSNTVSVIAPASSSVLTTFSTVAAPLGVAVSPDGTTVYVAGAGNSAVGVYQNTGSLVTTMTGFAYPVAIAFTPDGAKAFIVNENGGTVSIINTGTHSVMATAAVGSLPTSVAISSDGSEALVTNEFGFSLAVLSTSTGLVTKTIPSVGVYPIAVATIPPQPAPHVTCSYSLSSTSASLGSGGGSGSVNVTAPGGCGWQASSDSSWLTIQSGFSGSGNGVVGFSVAGNSATITRTGHLFVGGDTFTVTQTGVGFSPIRINCGGPAMTNSLGTWAADNLSDHSETTAAIENTSLPELYNKERWSTGALQYQFSVPNGSRTVKLHFAEIYLTSKGQRVFNIVVNGLTVLSNFDILGVANPNTAYDLTFPVSVSTGKITVELMPVTGSVKLSALEIY
jgi:YVTN family beta-propeller protein